MAFEMPCSCCIPTMLFIALGTIWVVLMVVDFFILSFIPKYKTAKKVYKYMKHGLSFLVGLIAIAFGILSYSPDLKNRFFFKFALMTMAKSQPLDVVRCEHISNISGRVLEIGPGPGTNFRCWENNTKITEWVGVEPNIYFHDYLSNVGKEKNLSFPISAITIKGENLQVEPNSFDTVIGTHLLCSVDDTLMVLNQITRALKPGGTYYFLEHIQAPRNTPLFYLQQVVQPIINVLGNGCLFKQTWLDLTEDTGLPGFDINFRFFDALVPIPPLVPHIIGTAVKR